MTFFFQLLVLLFHFKFAYYYTDQNSICKVLLSRDNKFIIINIYHYVRVGNHDHFMHFKLKICLSNKQVLCDLGTYLNKAIPDTKLTIQKYADAKFEYLSYCLKVKEMDDEELGYASLQEILYRVDTGNYEYRSVNVCIILNELS